MENSFCTINVQTIAGEIITLNVNNIESITPKGNGEASEVQMVSGIRHQIAADAKDILETIRGAQGEQGCGIIVQPAEKKTKADKGDDCLDSKGRNPIENEIIDIINGYNTRDKYGKRYSCFSEMLEYVGVIEVTTKDGRNGVVTGYDVIDDTLEIGKTISVALRQLTEESIETLLDELKKAKVWDTIYDYVNMKCTADWCIDRWNEMNAGTDKIVYDNCVVDLEGATADALYQAWEDEHYEFEDQWVTFEDGDVFGWSADNIFELVDVYLITDWLKENKDKAKEYLPKDIYDYLYD